MNVNIKPDGLFLVCPDIVLSCHPVLRKKPAALSQNHGGNRAALEPAAFPSDRLSSIFLKSIKIEWFQKNAKKDPFPQWEPVFQFILLIAFDFPYDQDARSESQNDAAENREDPRAGTAGFGKFITCEVYDSVRYGSFRSIIGG